MMTNRTLVFMAVFSLPLFHDSEPLLGESYVKAIIHQVGSGKVTEIQDFRGFGSIEKGCRPKLDLVEKPGPQADVLVLDFSQVKSIEILSPQKVHVVESSSLGSDWIKVSVTSTTTGEVSTYFLRDGGAACGYRFENGLKLGTEIPLSKMKGIEFAVAGTQVAPAPVPAPITALPLLEGRISRKPNAIVFGETQAATYFFDTEKLVVRTAKRYSRMLMAVGVEDNPEGEGSKHFWIRDEEDRLLAEGHARAGYRPADIDIDISDCDRIELNALDYNGQRPDLLRWINVRFIPK